MPTSNQKKTAKNPKKTPAKKTVSKKPEDSSPPEAHRSAETYGYAPRGDTESDLRLNGFISVTRADEEIAHIPVDMFIAGLFSKNSLPEADIRFSSVVEAAVTVPLNRMVRQVCEELLAKHEASQYADEADEDYSGGQNALPDFSPEVAMDPDDPALEEEEETGSEGGEDAPGE